MEGGGKKKDGERVYVLYKGADINAQGGKYRNALQAASAEGHEAVVKLLLRKGASVTAQGGEYKNAFQAPTYHGKIMRL